MSHSRILFWISCKAWTASMRGVCLAATGSIGTRLSSGILHKGKLYCKVDESTVGEIPGAENETLSPQREADAH